MPRLIRQILHERVLALPEVAELLRDFRRLSGLHIAILDPLGRTAAGADNATEPLCTYLHRSVGGCAACTAQQQAILEQTGEGPCRTACDFGLREVVVPIRVSGETVAYLRFGGHFPRTPDPAALNHLRHRCEQLGLETSAQLQAQLANSRVVGEELEACYTRWLTMAANHVAHLVTHHASPEDEALPTALKRACEYVRSRHMDALSLETVARQAGVSRAHLCRLFQAKVGLRFRDYLTRVRLARAQQLLESTDTPVTEICFAVGFQSVSAFNRAYKATHGQPPSKVRGRLK